MTREDYYNILKSRMSEKRFIHSICVSKEAVRLAEKYGANPQKAEVAGILHDVNKHTTEEEQLKIIGNHDEEVSNKRLLHSKSGAIYIEEVIGIKDQDIINAVRYHTTGRENMSLLEKIIFVADFTSKDRDYVGVEKIRELADKNIDEAVVEKLSFSIEKLVGKKEYIDPNTFSAYNYYVNNKESK